MGVDFLLATSQFRGSQQLFLGGYILQATNPLKTGENAAYSLRMDYPNDRWNAGMLYRGVQAQFDPAIGFTRRNAYQLYNPYVNFSPRTVNKSTSAGSGTVTFPGVRLDNQLVAHLEPDVLNVDLHSQDVVTFW